MLGRKTVLTLAYIVLAVAACAQEARKNEVGLLLGGTVTPAIRIAGQSDGHVDIGAGLTFQATYARELLSRQPASLYFELPFLAIPLQHISTSNGSVPANYDSLFVTPGLRLKLIPHAALSPWLSAGGGYALFDVSARRVDGTPNTGPIGTNRGAVQFGGGIDVQTPVKILFPIDLRLEVRESIRGNRTTTSTQVEDFSTTWCFPEDSSCISDRP